MKYGVNYFIKKFTAIPNRKWCTGTVDNGRGQHCALGHCKRFPEEQALRDLFRLHSCFAVHQVNDNNYGFLRFKTPRSRVLAELKAIKDRCGTKRTSKR